MRARDSRDFYRTFADLEYLSDLGVAHAGNVPQQDDSAVLVAHLIERGGKLASQLAVLQVLLGRWAVSGSGSSRSSSSSPCTSGCVGGWLCLCRA